ncbi:hypothetical protein KBC75_00280 [Candidatus Shapirobacteria bacterium]|nr:hypothetical protein [Candidatus Shapirobacteria bacterium]
MRQQGITQIGYVSGIISSEGPENIPKNLKRLDKYTKNLRRLHHFPIFSQNDIFSDDVYEAIKKSGATHSDFEDFYRRVHGSGFITHMFMTPKWELSLGATDEHKTALQSALKLIYLP